MFAGYPGLQAGGWAGYAAPQCAAPAPAPCAQQCAECPPIVENRQFAYQYQPVTRSCDQHYQQCQQQLRDNNNHILHNRVVLNNVNRHHHHVNRILVRDNFIHHYNTRYITRVNDIHHYRNEYVRAPGRQFADHKQTQQIERGVCRNAGIEGEAVAVTPAIAPAPAAIAYAPAGPAPFAPPAIAYAPASSCGCK